MMMGIGILVLLFLVMGIGSALKSPVTPEARRQKPAAPTGTADTTAATGSGEKNIDLSGSRSMGGQGQPAT